MKNIVNRALVAKKKQFLSMAVPRGTRTIWRYLGALILLFSLSIGNVWAASSVIPSSPDYKDISTVATSGTYTFTCSSSNITGTASATSSWIGWYSTQSSFKEYSKDGSATCMGVKTNIPNLKYDKVYFYVTNCTSFEIQAWGNGDNRHVNYSYQATDAASATADSFTSANNKTCASSGEIALNASKNYEIIVWNDAAEEIGVTYMVFNTSTGGGSEVCPETLTISSKDSKIAFDEGDAIELTAALAKGNGDITYQWYKGGTAEGNKLTGKTTNKLQIASCTTADEGSYYCVASKAGCDKPAVNASAFAITVEAAPVIEPTGTATITYALSGSTATGTVSGVSSISGLSTALAASTLTIGSEKSGYSGAISGCSSETELQENDYVDVQFTVASGYVFTPSAVSVKVNPFKATGAVKAVVALQDAALDVRSEVLACAKSTDNAVVFADGAFTEKEFEGTVHVRIYFYGSASSKDFYIKSPIEITGAVAVAPTKYDLEFAANGGEGTMSTLKYKSGVEVTLPACTFDAPSASQEFDAWVVTKKVGGASVTVTDGKFTMPTEAVVATATWKTKDVKYTVTYKEGTTTLGTEQVTVGGNPADAGDYEDKNLATFVDWYNNADLAEEHKIADISALVVTKDTTVYGKWTYTYAQSVNVEKWVLDNTKTPNSDKTGALISLLGTRGFASNLAYVESDLELDSLNDGKGTGRNYAYLGLKVKVAGKMLDFRLAKDNTVKVKFGYVGTTPLLAINGGDYAAMTIEDGVFAYTATGEDYISIKTADAKAVVFQQIMIGEDIQDVTLPEATRHAVKLTKAGETEHGTLAVASPETYNWLAEGAAVTLTVAADEGYYIESVTLNGEALTPSENVYSFNMPNATANVVATFAEIVPNNVTYKANNGGEDADILAENATEIAGCSFTYAGHKFNGWNTEANGSGDAYAEGDPVLSPLTLYAQWRSYFTITYMDGETELDTEDVLDGEAPVGIADPVKAFNIFKGWTLSGSDEVIDLATLTSSTTVYAKWETIDACFYYLPTKPAEAVQLTVDALVPGANGGSMKVLGDKIYNSPYGLSFESSGSAAVLVTLDKNMEAATVIKANVVVNPKDDNARGLLLRNAANSATVQEWTFVPAQNPDTLEFTYTVQAGDGLAGTNQFCIKRSTNAWLISLMVSNCAPEQFTVTYKDGEATLGTEGVYENGHPTADGINTHKKGYEFQGWAETVDGAVVDLNDITITAAKNLFAQYTVKDCSPKGVKFSMAIDGSKISANQYYPATTPAVGDLAVFATVTGGVAQAVNTSTGTTKNFEVKTTPEFKLGGSNSHMRILLDCPLAENDTIKFEKTERIILSFDSLKTKSENIAKTTSYYIVPAAYAGEDTIHIWYNSNGVSVNGVQVIRPEIYAVSFNLMGHGSAIAPIDVVKGGKITAPTAPTDEDYSFAGWYKENTLANEWKFDVDVVDANTTLYAKWLDKSDATLKSLKYGAEEIALQAGVYIYNVELPALSTSVPALTAETSNPNANAEVTNATAFDEGGNAQSTVVVTPEKVGAATQTYTVNFTKAASVALQDVTGSITWDFNGSVTADVNINNTLTVIANYAGVSLDGADKLEVKGTKFMKSPACVRANQMHFYTTVPGKLTVEYSNTGGNAVRYLYVNGVKYDEAGTESTAKKGGDTKVFVPAGDVELVMMDGSDASKELNIYRMIFNATPDYERPVSNNIGTLCVEHNVPAGQYFGATFYQIASRNALYNDKIDFEEVLPNEELKAGEPYIFQSTTGKIELFYGETVAAAPVEVRGMHGWFSDTEEFTMLDITEENKSDILYIAQNKLWNCEDLVTSDLKVVNNRAYIVMSDVPTYGQYQASLQPQQNSAPRRRVTIGGDAPAVTTGVENGGLINGENGVQKVLINGQIFILRGEKMYDATGRLVK